MVSSGFTLIIMIDNENENDNQKSFANRSIVTI